MKAIPYGKQKIEAADIEAVVKVLQSDFLTQGPAVAEFEKSVSQFLKKCSHDSTEIYATAVNNGTTALHLACLALGVKPGDKVLVTGNSFVASANCVLYCGGEVQFVDISPTQFCLDIEALAKIISAQPPQTFKGIVVVDFAGFVPDLQKLRALADQHHLWILEDACHALGSTRTDSQGKKYAAGGSEYSDVAVFSFHPVKHVATGEGGMITTRSAQIDQQVKIFRTHGITKDAQKMTRQDGGWYYEMQELGFNGRISDILCALGTSQMSRIEENLAARRKIADRYFSELKGLPLELPEVNAQVENAYHLFVIRTEKRKALYDYLLTQQIFAQVHYIPIYQQPFYVERYGRISLPRCDRYYETCLSIPMYHSLSEADQTRVIQEIKNFFLLHP